MIYKCKYCGNKNKKNGTQECGINGGYLEAHHMISFSNILSTNSIRSISEAKNCVPLFDVHNGITYCRECHIKNDTFRGRRTDKSEQF